MSEAVNTSVATDQRAHPAVLIVVCTALFFGVVNGSAVAVVLPEIGADLEIADGDLSWVLSGFLLTYGVAVPFYGRLANRFGARRLFLIGVSVFALGSALSAVATGLATLLAARTVQAVGGAAVPGLGMTLASRAFPEQRRGMVLGVVSATMGLGAAAGPLSAGIISELADWRYLFGLSVLAAVNVPLGMRYLDRNEALDNEPLDLAGGAIFGLGVASTLFFVTRGSQSAWADAYALTAAAVAVTALVTFGVHQRHGAKPFIPASLLTNRNYLLLTLLGFVITFANLAAQIGYPFLFNTLHHMSTLDIGVALIPAALTTAIVGVLAGRLVDKVGAAIPVRTGALVMITATLSLSNWVGASRWTVAIIAMAFAAGFALVNTPLAAVVSLLVEPRDLASALSLNTMMFFIGGSFGATLFSSIVINTGPDALNPLHSGDGAQFSNAFAALIIPIAIGLAFSAVLPRRQPVDEATPSVEGAEAWTHDCQIAWCPELEPELTTTATSSAVAGLPRGLDCDASATQRTLRLVGFVVADDGKVLELSRQSLNSVANSAGQKASHFFASLRGFKERQTEIGGYAAHSAGAVGADYPIVASELHAETQFADVGCLAVRQPGAGVVHGRQEDVVALQQQAVVLGMSVGADHQPLKYEHVPKSAQHVGAIGGVEVPE